MKSSIWARTVSDFNSDLAQPQPSPAAGSAAAVSARLAVSLLIKVLEISKRRKSAEGDHQDLDVLLTAAREESSILGSAADGDSSAFEDFLACVRTKADQTTRQVAMLKAIEVPMTAARSSVRALALSREAAGLVPTFIAADLGAAAFLLSGCVSALLMTVDYNLKQLSAERMDLAAERIYLQDQTATEMAAIISQIHP